MKCRRPVLRILAVVLVIGLIIWIARSCIDASPPDVADLRIAYDVIPADENAFTYFDRAADELQWPEETAQKDLLVDMASGKAWDDAVADEILAKNEGIFALIEQGLACPRCQLLEVTGYDDDVPYLKPWRSIARLGAIRAQWLLRNGHDQEAFEQAMLIIRFGHSVRNGRGSLIACLVGIGIEKIGLRQTRSLVANTALDARQLAALIPRLAEYRAGGQGLAHAFRVEYACTCNMLDNLVRSGDPCGLPDKGDRFAWLRELSFQPNKAKRALAAAIRTLIANSSATHAEATPLDVPTGNETWRKWKAFASGDGLGKVLFDTLITAFDRVPKQKCRLNVSVAVTQVLIALRCYQLEHGELPDTLDELVPEYLDSVPLDDFDGKPIRYSKAKRVVYSIGRDLVDSGGADKTDPHMDEPTVKIDF